MAVTIDYIGRLNRAYEDWMRRARAELEVLEIDTDRVPLQGPTPAFRRLVDDLKRRYPRQAELRLESKSGAPVPGPGSLGKRKRQGAQGQRIPDPK